MLQTTNSKQQTANNKQQTTNSKQQTANNKQDYTYVECHCNALQSKSSNNNDSIIILCQSLKNQVV
jgi:hypothetical protein